MCLSFLYCSPINCCYLLSVDDPGWHESGVILIARLIHHTILQIIELDQERGINRYSAIDLRITAPLQQCTTLKAPS